MSIQIIVKNIKIMKEAIHLNPGFTTNRDKRRLAQKVGRLRQRILTHYKVKRQLIEI